MQSGMAAERPAALCRGQKVACYKKLWLCSLWVCCCFCDWSLFTASGFWHQLSWHYVSSDPQCVASRRGRERLKRVKAQVRGTQWSCSPSWLIKLFIHLRIRIIVSEPAQAYKPVLNQLLQPYCTALVASRVDRWASGSELHQGARTPYTCLRVFFSDFKILW